MSLKSDKKADDYLDALGKDWELLELRKAIQTILKELDN